MRERRLRELGGFGAEEEVKKEEVAGRSRLVAGSLSSYSDWTQDSSRTIQFIWVPRCLGKVKDLGVESQVLNNRENQLLPSFAMPFLARAP